MTKNSRRAQRDKSRRSAQVGLPARRAAIKALKLVLDKKLPLDGALERAAMHALNSQDRALARAIVTTALRRKGQIDDVLGRFIETPLNRKKSGLAYEALLAGAAQILFMRVPAHAAIDLSARVLAHDLTGGRKLVNFLNGVLRNVERQGEEIVREQNLARLNTPGWLYESWTKAYGGKAAEGIALAHLEEAPLDLTVKSEDGPWAERLAGEVLATGSVRLAGNPGKVEHLEGFNEGAWWVQDAAASLPASLFGDITGKRVFDLCCAPGGKTAQLVNAGGNVISVDSSTERLERVRENLARLEMEAEIVCCDVLEFSPDEPADFILLDAPCSATGTIRRNPDVPHVKNKGIIKKLAGLQKAMLEKAATMIKPGGVLVYCTCSLQPEEGERQIARALKSGNWERLPIEAGEIGGLSQAITDDGDVRTLPSFSPGASGGMDGFFISRLRACGEKRNKST